LEQLNMHRIIRIHLPALAAAILLAAGILAGCKQEVIHESYRPLGPALNPGSEKHGTVADAKPAPGMISQSSIPKPSFWDRLLGRNKTPQPLSPPPPASAASAAKVPSQSTGGLSDMHPATDMPAQ
jgi:hypothetical protein